MAYTRGAKRWPMPSVTLRFSSSCSRRSAEPRHSTRGARRHTMALLRIPEEDRTLSEAIEITTYLADRGIEYHRRDVPDGITADVSAEQLLAAYGETIDELKTRGGYVTADVIDVKAETPGLEAMLKRFSSEHWHDEDEVRLIVEGRGIFHIHPTSGPVFALEVEAGDLIRVP